MSAVLAKPYRLRDFRDFSRVYKQGTRHRSPCLTLCVYDRLAQSSDVTPELSFIRIGVTVGYKVSKRAVIRNRIKRRIRAACRHLLPDLIPGKDVVITARSASIQCDYSEFLQQLKQLFTNAEMLHGH